MLPGIWLHDKDFGPLHHGSFRSVTSVATNGDYASEITITRSNRTETSHIAGTWRVVGGCLIDTLTNSSGRENLPFTTSQPIRRADESELVVGFGTSFRKVKQ